MRHPTTDAAPVRVLKIVELLFQRVLDGFSNKEIAERLNISVKTVEKHIGAALSQLRLRLSRSGFLRLFL